MTIVVKKAGEAIGKAVASSSSKVQVALKTPRAVTAAEAPQIAPAKVSTKTPLMPWVNWFDTWLKDNFGETRLRQWKETVNFMPDDIYDLQQSPKPSQQVPISKDGSVTAQWRYPSPGSQKPVRQPEFEEGEDPYDTAYYKKDTKRRFLSSELGEQSLEMQKVALMNPDDPAVQEEKKRIEAGPESSPGNKGVFATGPTTFDPTGLRATMSASWTALEQSLDANMPDHLPEPVWMGQEQAVQQWYESRNIPVPVGAYYAPLKVPVTRRVARW